MVPTGEMCIRDRGIAMGNAQEPVKKAADYITLTNDEDGDVYKRQIVSSTNR